MMGTYLECVIMCPIFVQQIKAKGFQHNSKGGGGQKNKPNDLKLEEVISRKTDIREHEKVQEYQHFIQGCLADSVARACNS